MALRNLREMLDAELEGRVRNYAFRKTPAGAPGFWSDFAISPGTPPPKYWFDAPPGVAQRVRQSTDAGIYHGANVSPARKYLRQMSIHNDGGNMVPSSMFLLDYLLYYPSIDESTTDEQTLDNSNTLTRYADGDGVQVIAVSVAARTGGQSFFFTYTNQDGVSGRISQTVLQNTSAHLGNIVTSAPASANSANPFIGLQSGDHGVRSIESVTMLGADVGLFSLILVKPLAQIAVQDISAFNEKDFLLHSATLPIIEDDAFLGLIGNSPGTATGPVVRGEIKIIWG